MDPEVGKIEEKTTQEAVQRFMCSVLTKLRKMSQIIIPRLFLNLTHDCDRTSCQNQKCNLYYGKRKLSREESAVCSVSIMSGCRRCFTLQVEDEAGNKVTNLPNFQVNFFIAIQTDDKNFDVKSNAVQMSSSVQVCVEKGSAYLQDLYVQMKEKDLTSDLSPFTLCAVVEDNQSIELVHPYILHKAFSLLVPEGICGLINDDIFEEGCELDDQNKGSCQQKGLLIKKLKEKQVGYFRELYVKDSNVLHISNMMELYDVMRYCEEDDVEFKKSICDEWGWTIDKWKDLWQHLQQNMHQGVEYIDVYNTGEDSSPTTTTHAAINNLQTIYSSQKLSNKDVTTSQQMDKKLALQWKCFVGILAAVREPVQEQQSKWQLDLGVLVQSGLLARCLKTLFQDMVGQGGSIEHFLPYVSDANETMSQ